MSSNKKLLIAILNILNFFLWLGFLSPKLISMPSTLAVILGFGMLLYTGVMFIYSFGVLINLYKVK